MSLDTSSDIADVWCDGDHRAVGAALGALCGDGLGTLRRGNFLLRCCILIVTYALMISSSDEPVARHFEQKMWPHDVMLNCVAAENGARH